MKIKKPKIIFLILILFLIFSISGCNNESLLIKKSKNNKDNNIDSVNIDLPQNPKLPEKPHLENENACKDEYNELIKKYKKNFNHCFYNPRQVACQRKRQEQGNRKNLMIIFDASGSMAGRIGGQQKIDIAQKSANKFTSNLEEDQNINLGLTIYGHKGNNTKNQKNISCNGIENVYKLGEINSQVIQNKINSLSPTGWTPIASALEKASQKLKAFQKPNDKNSILLISDGKETCDGNPIAKAKEIRESGTNMFIDVIGFDVSGPDEEQLQKISQAGGGKYFSVNSMDDFDKALQSHREFLNMFECKMEEQSIIFEDKIMIDNLFHTCLSSLYEEQNNIIFNSSKHCRNEIMDIYDERFNVIEEKLENNQEKAEEMITD